MLNKEKKNGKSEIGYMMYKGQKIPVLKADPKETISNVRTGQKYADMKAFLADVADPNTATCANDLRKDLTVTVQPIRIVGMTNKYWDFLAQ